MFITRKKTLHRKNIAKLFDYIDFLHSLISSFTYMWWLKFTFYLKNPKIFYISTSKRAIDDFEVSIAIVFRGANSGQTSIKNGDLAYNIFSLFLFTCNFLYLSVAWRSEKKKNISTCYYDAKESTNQKGYFLNFHEFS